MVAAVLSGFAVGGCSDDDGAGEGSSEPNETTSSSSSETPVTAPSLAAVCDQVVQAGRKTQPFGGGKAALHAYWEQLTGLYQVADEETQGVLGNLVDRASDAAETIGTIDYLDAEEHLDNALVKMDQACTAVGVPDVITGN